MSGTTPADLESNNEEVTEQDMVQSPLRAQDATHNQVPAATTTAQLNRQIERFYNLDITEMFSSGVPGREDDVLERRAMLLYHPEDHSEEIELITRWALMHNVEVGNLWYDGAWNHFQQDVVNGRTGIIIVCAISRAVKRTLTLIGAPRL